MNAGASLAKQRILAPTQPLAAAHQLRSPAVRRMAPLQVYGRHGREDQTATTVRRRTSRCRSSSCIRKHDRTSASPDQRLVRLLEEVANTSEECCVRRPFVVLWNENPRKRRLVALGVDGRQHTPWNRLTINDPDPIEAH